MAEKNFWCSKYSGHIRREAVMYAGAAAAVGADANASL